MLSFLEMRNTDRNSHNYHAKKLRIRLCVAILISLSAISAGNGNLRLASAISRDLQSGGRVPRSAKAPNPSESSVQKSSKSVNGTAEEDEEAEGTAKKISYDIVPLEDSSKGFLDVLLAALVNDTASWGSIPLPTYTNGTIIPQLANVFASLVVYITGPGSTTFLTKYPSLGYMLPMRMDVSELVVKNANLGTVWYNISWYAVQLLSLESKKTPGDFNLMSAVSLWEMVGALHNISIIDKRVDIKSLDQLTKEERDQYLMDVRTYFRGSCRLAWFRQGNLTTLEQINSVQLAGNYVNSTGIQPPDWYVPLISEIADRSLQEYSSVLSELALLKFASVEAIRNASGPELLGNVIDPYFEMVKSQASDMIQQSDSLISTFFGDSDPDIEAYINVSMALCKPEILIRFCFLTPMLQQMSIMASHKESIATAGKVTVFSKDTTDMKRSRYLLLLKERSEAQHKALAITDLFSQLNDSVQEAGNDITSRKHKAVYGEILTFTQLTTGKMAQIATQARMRGNSMSFSNDRRFNSSMFAANKFFSDVKQVLGPYFARLQAIGNAAHKAMEQRKIFGFLGTVVRVFMHVINPMMWYNPAAYADYTRAINQVRKDIAGAKGIKELNKLVGQVLIPRLMHLVREMLTEIPKLQQLRLTIAPFQNLSALTPELFLQHSQTFLRAYGEYNSPFTSSTVTELQEILSGYQSELCRISNARGLAIKECQAIVEDALLFSKMLQVVSTCNDAIDTLLESARGAVTAASANFFVKGMNTLLDGTDKGFDKMVDDWSDGMNNKELAYQKTQQRTKFLRAGAIYQLLVTSTEMFLMAAMTCSYFTYESAGVVIAPCTPILVDSSAPFELASLIAYQFNDAPEPIQRIAYIPTSPNSGLTYLSLDDLMATDRQQNLTFTIPQDVEWLTRYNWVPSDFDIKKHVIFVKSMAIVLPPSTSQPGRNSVVQVTTTAHQVTDLGPAANNQKFSIPSRTFDFSYREVQKRKTYSFDAIGSDVSQTAQGGGATTCSNAIRNLYQQCGDQVPDLCAITNGHADVNDDTLAGEVPLPSLFSTFTVSTKISAVKENKISYAGVQASAPLIVLVSLVVHDVDILQNADETKEGTSEDTAAQPSDTAPVEGAQDQANSEVVENPQAAAAGSPVQGTPPIAAPKTAATGPLVGGTPPVAATGAPPVTPAQPPSARQLATAAVTAVSLEKRKLKTGILHRHLVRKLDPAFAEEDGDDTGVVLEDTANNFTPGEAGASTNPKQKAGSNVRNRCCPKGSYLLGWDTQECVKCPPQHVSRMGGLYCVPKTSVSPK
uniref:AlNc14C40G3465 protein n=1 Tax=Albugo laibachii Nc14 TaxID=890382 RepID=F0W9L0_9STRA|nr:AlNc14C40G3465 [Albugo laibachii Nc14]|eukprot:CCA17828.1 AlNc14C40G3465 [Albugo laibachii Nc14]